MAKDNRLDYKLSDLQTQVNSINERLYQIERRLDALEVRQSVSVPWSEQKAAQEEVNHGKKVYPVCSD